MSKTDKNKDTGKPVPEVVIGKDGVPVNVGTQARLENPARA